MKSKFFDFSNNDMTIDGAINCSIPTPVCQPATPCYDQCGSIYGMTPCDNGCVPTPCDNSCTPSCGGGCTTTTCGNSCTPSCGGGCTTTTCGNSCTPSCGSGCTTTTCGNSCTPSCGGCTTTPCGHDCTTPPCGQTPPCGHGCTTPPCGQTPPCGHGCTTPPCGQTPPCGHDCTTPPCRQTPPCGHGCTPCIIPIASGSGTITSASQTSSSGQVGFSIASNLKAGAYNGSVAGQCSSTPVNSCTTTTTSPSISFNFSINEVNGQNTGSLSIANYPNTSLITSDDLVYYSSTDNTSFIAIFSFSEGTYSRLIVIFGTVQVFNILPTFYVYSAPMCGQSNSISIGGNVTSGNIVIS